MGNIMKLFKSQEDFVSLKGASKDAIRNAEIELGIPFASDYKEYLSEYGVASANGHEFTGIVDSPRLNVVQATLYERKRNHNVLSGVYVLERLGIDGIVIWQDSHGIIYETVGLNPLKKINGSFEEYLKSLE